jgi:peptidoglycan/xylan/chitin deacetylase (PgdA/CDA1 family)
MKSPLSVLTRANSIATQLSYLRRYSEFARYQKSTLEKAMLITSCDIDVGSPKLALLNKGKRDQDVNLKLSELQIGTIEEFAIPLFIDVFDDLGIPMTIAIRGQLNEVQSDAVDFIQRSKMKHDIGAHGYYHRMFTQLTEEEAEEEMSLTALGMNKLGIKPQSFIFPRNKIAHLNILRQFGYCCFRGTSIFEENEKTNYFIKKQYDMVNIPSTIFVGGENLTSFFLNKMLEISVQKKLPLHIWFHLWNFGKERNEIVNNLRRVLLPFLLKAKKSNESAFLSLETMFSASQKFNSL